MKAANIIHNCYVFLQLILQMRWRSCARKGVDGWLLSSHIEWLLNKLNNVQNTSINFVNNFCTADDLKSLKEHMGEEVERLTIVMNVGMDADGSAVVAGEWSGRHWVLVSLDLSSNPTVLYCDSLGWNSPTNLLESLSTFTAVFGIVKLERLFKMHVPTATGHGHHCTADCKNYPLQTCSNVCGVVAVVCAVLFALDKPLFNLLCGPLFLHKPTLYERYLRRVLMFRFISGTINTSLLKFCPTQMDHSYASIVSNGRKRKAHPPSDMTTKFFRSPEFKCMSTQPSVTESPEIKVQPSPSEGDSNLSSSPEINPLSFSFSAPETNIISSPEMKHKSEIDVKSCQCCICNFTCYRIIDLIKHYNKVHNKTLKICRKTFDNEEEFKIWEEKIEKNFSS